jgi:hypothetical protein
MASTKQPEEVQILHFFETAPIEKVEAVFNIVCEKVRARAPNRPAGLRKQRSKKGEESPLRSTEGEEQKISHVDDH